MKDEGARFENLIASHLLKWCHFYEDTQGRGLQLHFFRDLEQREVDFVITENRKPISMIEVKLSDVAVSKDLIYLKNKFPEAQAFQLYLRGKKHFETEEGILLGPAVRLLEKIKIRLSQPTSHSIGLADPPATF